MLNLRCITPEDCELLRHWRNQPQVARYMYSDHEIGADEHRRWFHNMMCDDTSRYWVITADDHDVGVANIYDIDAANGRAAWAFYVADSQARGKGIGTFVEYSVLHHAFEQRGLHKLMCEVLTFNEAVIAMHKKYGFTEEGILRDHAKKDGQYVDAIHLSMLEDEWPRAKEILTDRLRAKGLLDQV